MEAKPRPADEAISFLSKIVSFPTKVGRTDFVRSRCSPKSYFGNAPEDKLRKLVYNGIFVNGASNGAYSKIRLHNKKPGCLMFSHKLIGFSLLYFIYLTTYYD